MKVLHFIFETDSALINILAGEVPQFFTWTQLQELIRPDRHIRLFHSLLSQAGLKLGLQISTSLVVAAIWFDSLSIGLAPLFGFLAGDQLPHWRPPCPNWSYRARP